MREGNYVIGVAFARDKATVNAPESPGGFDIRILRTYADIEQPLTIHADIRSLNLTLADDPAPSNNASGSN